MSESIDNGGSCCPIVVFPPANVTIASNVLSTTGNVIAGNLISVDGTFTGNLYVGGSITGNVSFSSLNLTTLNSTTVISQAFFGNGAGISNLNSANISGTVKTALSVTVASQPNITSVGTMTGLNVQGLLVASNGSAISNLNSANIVGSVPTALSVTVASQPNITSLGTLTGLTVSGLAVISNGSAISNLNSANIVGTVGSAQSVTAAAQPNVTSVGTLTGLNVQGLVVISNGSAISNLNSSNIFGTVGTALSVTTPAQPNITSVGTLTGLTVSGLAVISNGSAISNLNSANIVGTVGTAQSVTATAQTNITSVGTLTGLTVSGLVVISNGSGISNLNSANIVGTVGTAQSVTNASQPNVTSVGTLTGLTVSGLAVISNGSGISNLNSSNLVGTISSSILPASGATAGTYGSSANVAQVTVDQYGRVTAASNVSIVSSQWVGASGSPIYYLNQVGIGTSAVPGANLQVTGNLYVTNSVTTNNVFFNNAILATNLPTVAGVIGGYGSGSNVPQMLVDQYGRISSISNVAITSSQWTSVAANVAYANGVSVGTLASPPPGSNLYVLGLATMSNIAGNGYGIYSLNSANLIGPISNSALSTTGVTPGVYGNGAAVAQFTVDQYGRINAASNVVISSVNAAAVFGTLSVGVLPTSGATAGTYGSSANIPQLAVDQYGRVTAASNVALPTSYTNLTITTANITSANVTTGNVQTLNSSLLATMSNLVVSGQANLFSANVTTLNVATGNIQSFFTTTVNVQTINATSAVGTFYGNILGSNLISALNIFAANSVTAQNIIAVQGLYGSVVGSNLVSALNVVSTNAVTTTNLFANTVTVVGKGANVFSFANASGASNVFVMDSLGNLGVGTGTPAFKVDVIGNMNLGKTPLDNYNLNFSGGEYYIGKSGQLLVVATNNVGGYVVLDTIFGQASLDPNGIFVVNSSNIYLNGPGSNIWAANAITTTNAFLTNMNVVSSNLLTANIRSANATSVVVPSSFTANATNTTFFFDTFTIPFINAAQANVTVANVATLAVSTANLVSANILTANITSLNVSTIEGVSNITVTQANISFLNVYTQANVLTANIQTANVVTENVQFVNVSSNLTVFGQSLVSGTAGQSFNFTVAAGVGSFSNVCVLRDTPYGSGIYIMYVDLMSRGAGGSAGTKSFLISTSYNLSAGNWLRAIPLSKPGGPNQIGLDLLSSGGQTYMRATRLDSAVETVDVGLVMRTSSTSFSTVVITDLTSQTGTGATNSGFWPTAIITENNGLAGIFTEVPSANLHVTGNIYASNALSTTNVISTSANISFATISTLANIASANIVTANVQSLNVVFSNLLNLNVSTGANVTYLTAGQANLVSSNLVTANIQTSNTVFANVLNLNVSTGANVTYLTAGQANLVSSNLVTANVQFLNVVFSNLLNLNVSTGANVTYLTAGQANLVSSNLVTTNVQTLNAVFSNLLNLNVSTGANVTYLTAGQSNLVSSNLVTANVQTLNVVFANVITLNVSSLEGVTNLMASQANSVSSNLVTANIQSLNTVFANILNLNVSTGANITQLSVTSQANVVSANLVTANVQTLNVVQLTASQSNLASANLVTANVQSLNVVFSNLLNLNVSTGANVTYLTTGQANVVSSNLVTANVQTLNVVQLTASQSNLASANLVTANVQTLNAVFSNLLNLNVSTGANVTYLTAGQANLVSSNLVTANVQSLNAVFSNLLNLNVSTGANVTYLTAGQANLVSSNLVTANIQTENVVTSNILNLNVNSGANITYLTVSTLSNSVSSNILTANIRTANIQTDNVVFLNVSTTANVTNLTVTSNIVPLAATGNTYLTGNLVALGNVYSQLGLLGAGGGYYFSLPNFIVTQTPYTGSIGTAYPLSVGLSNGFTINGTSTMITVTANGNFKFNTAGPYILSAVFYSDDNITGLALGSNAADVHGTDQNYMYRHMTQITQNPTEQIDIPFNVTDTSKYYYLDLFATAPTRLYETANTTGGGTYLTITPLTGGGLATGGPGGTPGTQWISSGSNIYFPNSVGVGTSPAPGYNLDVSTGTTATQFLVTSNISSLGLYGPTLNVNSNVIITANLAVGGLTAPSLSAALPYALTVYGQGYFSNHVSYQNFAGFRNRLVNGTFRVAYRANSITVSNTSVFSVSNTWVVDRWRVDVGGLATSNVLMTVKQDVPVGPTNGFTQCANVYVTRGLTGTTGNTWVCPLSQTIEASFMFDFKNGQPTSKYSVFSFTANTSVSGDYSVVFRSRADNTYFANLVSIASGSWQTYTVYLPPCTIGTWATLASDGYMDILIGGVSYGVNSSNNRAVAVTSSWTANPGFAPVSCIGATKWPAGAGTRLQITAPQLEEGTIATPFEVRPLTQTIIYCQRFFETNPDIQYAAALGSGRVNSVPFVVTKRAHANVSVYRDLSNLTANTNISQFVAYYGDGTLKGTQAITSYLSSEYGFSFNFINTGSKFMDASIMEAQFVWQADAEIY